MNKQKLKVGDRLFVTGSHLDAGYYTISKVGKKYFEFKEIPCQRFLVNELKAETNEADFPPRQYFILSESEEQELREIQSFLFYFIRDKKHHSLSLATLRKIKDCINQDKIKAPRLKDECFAFWKAKDRISDFLKKSSYASLGIEKLERIQEILEITPPPPSKH